MPDRSLPPQPADDEAERQVLGAVLLRPDVLADPDVRALRPGDFYAPAHADVLAAALAAQAAGNPVEPAALAAALAGSSSLRAHGGPTYLLDLTAGVGSVGSAGFYARRVRDLSVRRALVGVGERIVQEASNGHEAADVLPLVQRLVLDVGAPVGSSGPVKVGDLFGPLLARADDPVGSGPAIRTGLPDLDALTGGFKPGHLVIVGARTSVGKTSLGVQTALWAARHQGVPSLVFSLEMTRDEITARVLALLAEVPVSDLLAGAANMVDLGRAMERAGRYGDLPLHVEDGAALSATEVASLTRQHVARHGTRLVVVDYVQRMSPSTRRDSRNQELGETVKALKTLARETEATVLALAQLSRAPARGERKPGLHDLRDSGEIEQEADLVALLSRQRDHTLCDVAKHRNGATGEVRLRYNGPLCRFESPSLGEGAADWSATRADLR